jgi:hypothetical protein
MLATVLFSDIVGSLNRLGDRSWRALLDAHADAGVWVGTRS